MADSLNSNSAFDPSLIRSLFIGTLIHWGLHGVLTVQIFLYYKAFSNSKDHLLTRLLVYFIYFLETIQIFILTYTAYSSLGIGFQGEGILGSPSWADFSFLIKTGLVGLCDQLFSAWRIWMLSKSWLMTAIVVILSVVTATATFLGGSQMIASGVSVNSSTGLHFSAMFWAASSAVCEITIAAFLVYILLRSRTGIKETNDVILRVVHLVITTGSVTALVALLALALLLAFPNKSYFTTSFFIVGKIDANTCLLILNSRMRIIGDRRASTVSNDGVVIDLTSISRHEDLDIHFRRGVYRSSTDSPRDVEGSINVKDAES